MATSAETFFTFGRGKKTFVGVRYWSSGYVVYHRLRFTMVGPHPNDSLCLFGIRESKVKQAEEPLPMGERWRNDIGGGGNEPLDLKGEPAILQMRDNLEEKSYRTVGGRGAGRWPRPSARGVAARPSGSCVAGGGCTAIRPGHGQENFYCTSDQKNQWN